MTSQAEELAAGILQGGLLPGTAVDDALHLSLAVVHERDFLLTWNCRHLANAELLRPLETWLASNGFPIPSVCTPDELLEKPDAHDEVITELWRVKDAIAEEYNCDIHALVRSLREDEKKHPPELFVEEDKNRQDTSSA